MSTETENTNTRIGQMDRRKFLKRLGTTAGSAAVVGTGADRFGISPVSKSEGFWPAVGAGIVIGTGVTWTLSEIGVIGSDAPPDSLGPQALKDQIYQTIRTRKSTNQSTIVDNNNILSYIEEPAFADAKVAAVEAINKDKTKSEVTAEAEAAVNAHIATVEKNLLKTWNESVSEITTIDSLIDDSSLSVRDVFTIRTDTLPSEYTGFIRTKPESITLSDGSSFELKELFVEADDGNYDEFIRIWDPISNRDKVDSGGSPLLPDLNINPSSSDAPTYLKFSDWNAIWSGIQTAKQNVSDNVDVWVDNAYDAIQAGQLNPDELLTPGDLSDSYAGDNARAIADLQALNIPNAGGNEATIQVSDEYNSTMSGMLAHTGEISEVNEGDTIDPNATDSDGNPVYQQWFISHNLADWEAETTQYFDSDFGIQGGNLRATRNPNQIYGNKATGITYAVTTTNEETATIPVSEFTQDTDENGNTIWTADVVDQLSTTTTGIAGVTAYQSSDETRYQTEPINNPFEVLETSDGPLKFNQPREPQTDSNYLTQEEWENFRENTQENINAYKESQDVDLPGIGAIGGAFGSLRDLAVAAVLVILALFGLSAASN